ncbi:hypothetical protein L7E55_15520 [Pelotomaculum isophthalicicum JI]|uniref:Uncharacterized protein n=1 Tax=Pelotomaculum isophthalicicum JI TaxID=947010 RepID=A0A9X4H3L7_9FIRM|nr:hypothetical protein [Pelotomaculum isophthalicicum]MDF9409741.1 hypothetical protein [Pelotomaculum isophthalicicum JI]
MSKQLKQTDVFEEDFFSFICDRQEIAFDKMLEGNKTYHKYDQKWTEIYNEIRRRTRHNEELFNLVDKLNNVEVIVDNITSDAFYFQGFRDGFMLSEIMRRGLSFSIYENEEDEDSADEGVADRDVTASFQQASRQRKNTAAAVRGQAGQEQEGC